MRLTIFALVLSASTSTVPVSALYVFVAAVLVFYVAFGAWFKLDDKLWGKPWKKVVTVPLKALWISAAVVWVVSLGPAIDFLYHRIF